MQLLSPSMIGGLLLIIGAYFTFKGNMYVSVGTYFLADICWVILAYTHGDTFGAITTCIGMTLGLFAFMKMNSGKFRKTLDW